MPIRIIEKKKTMTGETAVLIVAIWLCTLEKY
jgi:hypothetical protein